jgi:hypothetical protein
MERISSILNMGIFRTSINRINVLKIEVIAALSRGQMDMADFICVKARSKWSWLTSMSIHVWTDGAPIKRWAPSYDPEIVAAELDHAAESSGVFWSAKSFRGTRNSNRAADLGASPSIVGFISWLINGGGAGYRERQQYAVTLEHILLDTIRRANREALRYPALTPPSHSLLCSAFPPIAVPFSQSITIDYAPQVP